MNSYNCKFVDTCWSVSDIEYCSSCHHSKQLFGCFGLRHKNEFCILNKQYSKEEYEVLRAKIIDEMRSRREYGEFFPSRLSPFAYNETVANDFYPLSKDQAQKQRFTWKDDDPKNSQSQTCNLADNI